MIIMIYVNCLYYLGYHIRNKQKENTGSGTFAVCKNHGTRQRNQCLPCAKAKAHGKHLNFAVCHVYRHTAKAAATSLPRVFCFFCRGSALAHGKGFAVCPINGTRQTTLCRRLNAVCSLCGTRQSLWHTAKQQSPVVMDDMDIARKTCKWKQHVKYSIYSNRMNSEEQMAACVHTSASATITARDHHE